MKKIIFFLSIWICLNQLIANPEIPLFYDRNEVVEYAENSSIQQNSNSEFSVTDVFDKVTQPNESGGRTGMLEQWQVAILLIYMGVPPDSALVTMGDSSIWVYGNTATFYLEDGTYLISVFAEGYYPFEGGAITVIGALTIDIFLYPILYGVTFFVNCCGEPLESIPITYEGQTVMTNVAGLAILNMPAGFYSFEIEGVPVTFTVPDTVYVPVDICSQVTFHITSGGENISGTSINVENETKLTDESGEAIFNLTNGSYPYTIEKDGYITETGQIIVLNEPVIVEMHLSCEVTFFAFCEGPYEGAVIMCENNTVVTNSDGYAYMNLEDGTHEYTIIWLEIMATANIIVNGGPLLINEVCTSVFNYDFKENLFYPNPSTGKFSIENINRTGEPTEIFVTDITGRIVYQTFTSNLDKTEIDLTDQPMGMYFVRVKSGEMVVNRKVVIQ